MAYKSKEDLTKYHREVWYPKNKARRLELNRAWRLKVKQEFQDFKKNLFCVVCGEKESVCLDFHHTDPNKKDNNVSTMLSEKNVSFKKIMAEVDKCTVLCSNCHRKVHAGVIELPT